MAAMIVLSFQRLGAQEIRVRGAVTSADTGEPLNEASVMACHAKAHLAEVCTEIANKATLGHGGMGFTDLMGVHYWFKRIGYNRQILGGPEAVRADAAALQGLVAA